LLSWGVSRYVQRAEAREESLEMESVEEEAPAAMPAFASQAVGERCWEVKGCAAERKSACPACRRLDLPCWLAKQLATGTLSQACQGCAIYGQSMAQVA
jgi:hypothetical protein